MRPFQEFRLWSRRAPLGERAVTGVVSVIVVALLGVLLVPDRESRSTDVGAFGNESGRSSGGNSAADTESGGTDETGTDVTDPGLLDEGGTVGVGGVRGTGGVGGAKSGSTGGGDGGGVSPRASTANGGKCVSPPGTMNGVSDKEIKIGVGLTEIGGAAANQLFDIQSPEQQQADYEAAIAGINREGGIACRKVVARYWKANPVNEQGMMQICREVADAKVFAMVDSGSLSTKPAVIACFGQNKIPYFGAFYITEKLRTDFYPYIYSFYFREQVYKNTAFALRERGFFDASKGFKKLGFVFRECNKEAIDSYRGFLREVGGTDLKRVEYNLGCPAVFALQPQIDQAVASFKAQGVTHVTGADVTADIASFTNKAQEEDFRPVYGLPDEALQQVATGSRAPNAENFINATLVTLSSDGEHQTPGTVPSAGTKRCDALRRVAGLKPVYQVPAAAGHTCSQLWMLQNAANNAPQLSPAGLQAGLQRTGSIDFSFPQGPNDFKAARTTTGGQFWRVVQFKAECKCWRVVQSEFRRGF